MCDFRKSSLAVILAAAATAASPLASSAVVELSLASTNDYDFAMPPAATNAIRGIGMGYDDPYHMVRYEDVSFLLRALYERWCWKNPNTPHWGRMLTTYGFPFSLAEVLFNTNIFNASSYMPWSCGATNTSCYVADDPMFAEGVFRCDDVTSWKVLGHDYSKLPPVDTMLASSLISTNLWATNTLILRTTPVSLTTITNNYHNLALLNHLAAGPFAEVFDANASNRLSDVLVSYNFDFTYATNEVEDPETHRKLEFTYLSGVSRRPGREDRTESCSRSYQAADTFDFVHLKRREFTTFCSVRVVNADTRGSIVTPVATYEDTTEDYTDGDPSVWSQPWRVTCKFNSKWTDEPFTNSNPIAYFVGLFEVSDITETSYSAAAPISESGYQLTTNRHDRMVYVFKDIATKPTEKPPAGDAIYYDFELDRAKFWDYFMTESGVGSDVPDPPAFHFPAGKIPATVDGNYGYIMAHSNNRRTKRISLKDVYVIWYVTPLFRARVTSPNFNLN